ncbi:MAG: cyclic-di-AMP receptor [Anaerolineae bacterium]|nr:cyclic-di-AMP receptor [Anaerolineae bacterium]
MAGKMVISIVHIEDTPELVKVLNEAGFGVTQMSTTGGFLRHGNATLMIGVEEERVDQVMEIIKVNTKPHSQKGWWRRPGRHQMNAATVFVVDMERARIPS